MRTTAVLLAASAAVVTAQATYDNTTGLYHCAKPNTAFCAGDSLHTDIIIRCNETGIGQPGRCSNNLNGAPPIGVKSALCYQPDAFSGNAACEKNCVVYSGDGTTFTLPASLCTPASAEPTTTITLVNPIPTPEPTTTITFINPGPTPAPTTTITYIDNWGVTCTTTYVQPPTTTSRTNDTITTTITYIDDWGVTCTTGLPAPPKTTLTTTFVNPTQPHGPAVTGSGNGGYTNGTCASCPGGSNNGGSGNGGSGNGGSGNGGSETGRQPPSPTKIPDDGGPSKGSGQDQGKPGPSSRPTGVVTAGASINGIGGAAILAMVAAFVL